MAQEYLRFVVVGAGHMGLNHIKKINSTEDRIGARVSVVVEPDELRATALAREFAGQGKNIKFISNLGQLNQVGATDYPDAAIVAVPASIHVETAAACLTQGLHTLVEKPLGFSALDCRDLEQKSVASKKIVHVGLLERWSLQSLWSDWRPKVGPWTINSVRSGPFVPRAADTDVIHDLMIHDIDLFVLLDSVFQFAPVTKVRAWGRKLRSGLIDYAIVALDMEDGGMARFFASRLSADSHRNWEMTGPDWHASIDFMRRSLKRFERVGRDMNAFEAKEKAWIAGDPLGLEIEAFIRSIRGDTSALLKEHEDFCPLSKLLPTPQNVLRTHEIIDEVLSCIQLLS